MDIRSTPSITRVHTIHRIRTVVNYVGELIKQKAKHIDDIAIAKHLIETKLSVPTTKKFRDQIGRRARDHLETARYLGFLCRMKSDGKYSHSLTPWALPLQKHKFNDECPGSIDEEVVFTDRVCRLKLANTSYMQSPRGYESHRSRICLNLLYILTRADAELDVSQVAYILAEKKLDCVLNSTKLDRLLDKVRNESFKTKYRKRLTTYHLRNIRRDTDPFLDWCAQLSLVKKGETISITERGKQVLNTYSNTLPIWWSDLKYPDVFSAILIVMNYLVISKRTDLVWNVLEKKYRDGLFPVRPLEKFAEVIGFSADKLIANGTIFDFTMSYDVPPDHWDTVKFLMSKAVAAAGLEGISPSTINKRNEFYHIGLLRSHFKKDIENLMIEKNLKLRIPSASIYAQFSSDYETMTYVLLKSFERDDFRVNKYQKQISELMVSRKWKRIASHNPDLLLSNDFMGLVDCKSTGEWGEKLKYSKKVVAEIALYNQYVAEILNHGITNKCKAIFSYEGAVDNRFAPELEEMLRNDYPHVYIICRKALQKALADLPYRNELRNVLERKESMASTRIIDA